MKHDPDQSPSQKVLVIDDCPTIRSLVKHCLKDEAIDLHTAGGGLEGLSICRTLIPDLVLLDLDMPDLDGPEVLRRLKSDTATLNVPVICLTGQDSTDSKVAAFDLGAADYVTKPFNTTELRARVRAALRTKYLLDLLAQKAMIDGLTGLWNRTYFDERLGAEISLSRRTLSPLSMLMIDIDHFKSVNDTHGHPFGDEVLRAVSHAIALRLRGSDVVCRFGGEEFAVILPNTNEERAGVIAEDLRALIYSLPFIRGRESIRISASFGAAVFNLDNDAHWLLQSADTALYAAKRLGRNRVAFAQPQLLNIAAGSSESISAA